MPEVRGPITNLSPLPDIGFQYQPDGQPWTSVAAAHAGTPGAYRAIGKVRFVDSGDGRGLIEYMYKEGIDLVDLVERYENLESAATYLAELNDLRDETREMNLQATTSKNAAGTFAQEAKGARDSAIIGAGVYETEALGRAAVADGQAFKVQGTGDAAAYEYRRVNSSTSTLLTTYPSLQAAQSGISALAKVLPLETAAPKAKYIWKDRNAAFSNASFIREVEVVNAIRDVQVFSEGLEVEYALQYIRRGDATNATSISLNLNQSGATLVTTFGNGVVGGVQIYKCLNESNGDEIFITIDWTGIDLLNTNLFTTASRTIFAKSCYTQKFREGNPYIFENPYSSLTTNERRALKGVVSGSVRSASNIYNTYSIRFIRRGSESVATSVSVYINKTGTSFSGTYGTGVVSGIQEYKFSRAQYGGDEIAITINWDKTDLAAGEQIDISLFRATLSKSLYSIMDYIDFKLFDNPSNLPTLLEVPAAVSLRSVSILSVNPTHFYSLNYVQRGNITEPSLISFYNNTSLSESVLDLGIGVTTGKKAYVLTTVQGDKISFTIDWDQIAETGALGKVVLNKTRGYLSKALYSYKGLDSDALSRALEPVKKTDATNPFYNVTAGTPWSANELKIMPYISGLYIKSNATVPNTYAFSQITRGSESVATAFQFQRIAETSNYDTFTLSIGVVSGTVRYSFTTSLGDVIVFWVNWDTSTMAAGEVRAINLTRGSISKSAYGYVQSETITRPEFILPPFIPYALGREFAVWKESIRNLTDTDEPLYRLDIETPTAPIGSFNVDHTRTFKYQLGVLHPSTTDPVELAQAFPTTWTNFQIRFSNRSRDGQRLNYADIALRHTSNRLTNPATSISMLRIGDSNGAWFDKIKDRELKKLILDNVSFVPTFIGTQTSTSDVTVKNEARSGWTSRQFVETGSPFVFSGVFNFSQYMSTNGFSACDVLFLGLGANDFYASNNVTPEQYIANLQTIITSAWAFNANMRIIIEMPTREAYGRVYNNVVKVLSVPYLKGLITAFSSYNSPSGKPAILCPLYMVNNRTTHYGSITDSQRDGTPNNVYGTVHKNQVGYYCEADINFSSMMYALNN